MNLHNISVLHGHVACLQYNSDLYRTQTLREYAEIALSRMPDHIEGLVCRGSSGTALASAMCTLSTRPLLVHYVAKRNEFRHGGDSPINIHRTAVRNRMFVDDWVSSGSTMKNAFEAAPFRTAMLCSGFVAEDKRTRYHSELGEVYINVILLSEPYHHEPNLDTHTQDPHWVTR